MMRIFLIILFSGVISTAQEGAPFLWKIKGAQVSYILGTVHVGVSVESDLPPLVGQAFYETKKLAVETDTEEMRKNNKLMAKYMVLPDKESLRTLISAAALKKLLPLFPQQSEQAILKYQPWALSSILLERIVPSSQEQMDAYFVKKSKNLEKQISYLEDWQFQLKNISELDRKALAKALERVILEPEKVQKEYLDMKDLYLSGNASELAKFVKNQSEEVPGMYERLFHQRNKLWVDQIVKITQSDSVFIAVGAGHLVGEKNLIELLMKKGLKIVRCQKTRCE